MSQHAREEVLNIPIRQIYVLNPRSRNKRVQQEMIENIRAVGLKRPITVARRPKPEGGCHYNLICGQGRLEAFRALNQTEIPAFVLDATQEESLVMSLVENVARRNHTPLELMQELARLRDRGHSDAEIASRIGVSPSWLSEVGALLARGEERLVAAVEAGVLPLSMAMVIAKSSEEGVREVLADAYEDGIRGRKLAALRRLIEARSKSQRSHSGPTSRNAAKKKPLTLSQARRMFAEEAEKHRIVIQRAEFANETVLFLVQAFKQLLRNSDFVELLKKQGVESMPTQFSRKMHE
ncbi:MULTISPECIES: plasmid partitioning protein RepB C-terminal domain-containing protein [Bacteria]|uniref:ParB family protein n=1 Tax=Lysobacter enzymogenes TaxID=69 RepID=A0AAU9AUC1_LYSEN|nr:MULTISPECIES: plasmid partitioning protein RepB C-terminal domain-containing protein [Pseudomonadota]BAV99413.1 ParB family protein [Lysobacter enzymogenes]